MADFAGWLTIANFVIMVAMAIGGIFVFRGALSKAESDVGARVREALHDENELLQARVIRLEKENRRLESLIQLTIATLKRTHQIELEIDGEVLTMRSPNGTHVTRIPPNSTYP